MTCKICASAAMAPLYLIHNRHEINPFTLLECRACGFRFIDCLDRPGGGKPQREWTEGAAEEVAELESDRARLVRNIALLRAHAASGAVLDVGCGGGGFLRAIEGSHAPLIGIEPDPRYRAVARRRGLEVDERDVEHACWDDRAGTFDAITLWDVIEHVNDPAAVARRAFALLRPGGALLIDTPTRDGFLYRFGNATAWLTGGRRATTMGVQYSSAPLCHKQIFRRGDMRRMLAGAGFRDIRIEQIFELSCPPDYYTRLFIPVPWLRRLLNPLLWLALRLAPIRNKMIVTARK